MLYAGIYVISVVVKINTTLLSFVDPGISENVNQVICPSLYILNNATSIRVHLKNTLDKK